MDKKLGRKVYEHTRKKPYNPTFPAKYPGTCAWCGQHVAVGTSIYYARKGRVLHAECWRETRE